jgi:hypothetical protein
VNGVTVRKNFRVKCLPHCLPPARFSRSDPARKFAKTIVPQAQLQLAAEVCPLYPQSGHFAVRS